MTKKDFHHQGKPWITKDIKIAIKKREKLYRKFVRAKDAQKKEEFHHQYKTIRNEIVTMCRENKKLYYNNYFQENSNNIKNTWKGIKTIINLKEKTKSMPTSILVDKIICNDQKQVTENFNQYFATVACKLQEQIYNAGVGFEKYLHNPNEKSFFFRPTNKEEILLTINNLKSGKSSGPNSIHSSILDLIKFELASPLAEILNLSFETGIYMNKLKISDVLPIYKETGNELDCSNYRPISLLSNINKIFEKIVHSRVYDFLDSNKCIYENQFGFRKKHSTVHALLNMTEDIRHAIDNDFLVCGVFIDLKKAFDTVDHSILLKKMDYYGLRGITNNWFKSYLTNRYQYVTINGHKSTHALMRFGVPQGSVLGPLLFLIYINDLHFAIKNSTTRHFADDTNIIIKNKSAKVLTRDLNVDLAQLTKWLRANKISLNTKKTELLIFCSKQRKISYDIKVKINGKKLIPVNHIKYLGVYIDCHLDWTFHTNILSTKLSRAVGILSKVRHYVPKEVLHNIYHGIFSSILNYGSIIWGQKSTNHIKRIENIQNKAIRTMNFVARNTQTNILYKNSKILKFTDQIKVKNFLLVHDSINGQLPYSLRDTFTLTKNNHPIQTRHSAYYTMIQPRIHTVNYGEYSIKFQAVKLWNKIMHKFPEKNLQFKSRIFTKKFLSNDFLNDL